MATDSSIDSGRPDLSPYFRPNDATIFSSILNTLEEPFFLLDKAFRLRWHNSACDHLYYEVSGKHIDKGFDYNKLLTPDQQTMFRQHLVSAAEGENVHLEWKYKMTVTKWLSVSLYAFKSPDGLFEGVCGSLRDITEQKMTEQVLLRNTAVLNNIREGVILKSLGQQVLTANDSAMAILGLDAGELKEKGFPSRDMIFVDEDENEISHEGLLYRRNGQIHGVRNKVIGIRRPDGIQWLKLNSAVVASAGKEEPYTIVISFGDITEQKNILREMEVLALLARETVNSVIILHPEGELLWMNEGFARLTGYAPEELIGKSSRAFLLGPDTNMDTVMKAAYCRQHSLPFQDEFLIYRKDGKKLWTRVQGQAIGRSKGAAANYFLVIRDITEDKKIRQELEVLSLVAKETNNGVVIFDRSSYHAVWVNEGFTRLTDYAAEEIIGKNPVDSLKGPETDRQQLRLWADRIAGNLPYNGDFLIYRKDGQKRILHITGQPLKNEHGNVTRYFAIGYDVTDQRRMEEERLQYEIRQQRNITRVILETQELERNLLGRELHDNINQLLAAIRLQLSYSLQNFSNCRPVLVQCRENIIDAIDEVRQLSHRMVMPRFSERTLPEMLENLADNYRYAQTIRVDISRWKDDAVPVPVKEVLFRIAQEQLSNIYKHAKATQVTICIASRQDGVALTVEDDGIGFSPAEKKGGIGLSNIRSRVESNDGTCLITSAPGQGCILLVDIPLA